MAGKLPTLSPLIWAFQKALEPETQRWAFSLSACVDGAIAVILLHSAWRPSDSILLVQFLVPAFVVALAANIPFVGPGIIVGYSPLLLILLALALGSALIPEAWFASLAQSKGTDALAHSFGWASLAEHECNFWLIGLFAAFKRPGSTLLTFLVAGCLVYLGTAAIYLHGNAGSWGFAGGVIAIIGSVAYIALGFIESRAKVRMNAG
jgi:hypothetical protein